MLTRVCFSCIAFFSSLAGTTLILSPQPLLTYMPHHTVINYMVGDCMYCHVRIHKGYSNTAGLKPWSVLESKSTWYRYIVVCVDICHAQKQNFKGCCTIWRESQLSANNTCIHLIPKVTADSSPSATDTYFNPSFITCTTPKANVTICAVNWENRRL